MIARMSLLILSNELDLVRQEQEQNTLNRLLNEGYTIIIQREIEKRHVETSLLLILWRKDDEVHT